MFGRSGSWRRIESGWSERLQRLNDDAGVEPAPTGHLVCRRIALRQKRRSRAHLASWRAAVHLRMVDGLGWHLAVHFAARHVRARRWSGTRRHRRERQPKGTKDRDQQPDHAPKDRCERLSVNECERRPRSRSPNVCLPHEPDIAGCLKESPRTGCCEPPSNGQNWCKAALRPIKASASCPRSHLSRP
jgi:hypothetical protein